MIELITDIQRIVPTPVGVNRRYVAVFNGSMYCPHARGGEPTFSTSRMRQRRLSPRPWG